MGRRVTPKRLILALLLAVAASVVLVPGASAGDFDPTRMNCTGDDPATCPTGQVGVPYSLSVRLVGDQDTGCAVLRVSSGSLPAGLSITQQFNETKAAIISGTPTTAENFSFFLTVDYNAAPGCAKSSSDNGFIIKINPEVPRLILQPEQSACALLDRRFSVLVADDVELARCKDLDDHHRTASGRPGARCEHGFDLRHADRARDVPVHRRRDYRERPAEDPPRSDTKALTITVRSALAITGPGGSGSTAMPPAELAVPFEATLTATGGTESFTWSLTAGALPAGVALQADGTIAGRPRQAGRFSFTATVTDTEVPTPRSTSYVGVINVAARLDIATERIRPGKVGKLYRAKLTTSGGVKPTTWKVKKGPLPRGVRLDRTLGVLSGTPRKAGTYRVWFEVTDELGVKSTQRLVLVVAPATPVVKS